MPVEDTSYIRLSVSYIEISRCRRLSEVAMRFRLSMLWLVSFMGRVLYFIPQMPFYSSPSPCGIYNLYLISYIQPKMQHLWYKRIILSSRWLCGCLIHHLVHLKRPSHFEQHILPHVWPRHKSCRKRGVCGNAWFPHGCLDVSHRS